DRAPEEAGGPTAFAARAQPVEVGDVGVDALHGGGQAGRAGGDDDVATGPVEPRVGGEPQVGHEVGLAEPEPRHERVRGGEFDGAGEPGGGLDQQLEREPGAVGDLPDDRGVGGAGEPQPGDAGSGDRVEV